MCFNSSSSTWTVFGIMCLQYFEYLYWTVPHWLSLLKESNYSWLSKVLYFVYRIITMLSVVVISNKCVTMCWPQSQRELYTPVLTMFNCRQFFFTINWWALEGWVFFFAFSIMPRPRTDSLFLSLSHPRDLNFNNLMVFPKAIEALPKLKEVWVHCPVPAPEGNFVFWHLSRAGDIIRARRKL